MCHIQARPAPGYRQEANIDPRSATETFAALKLFIDNWRWQDIPFYLRTGKRMPQKVSQVIIQFRPVPHQSFPLTANNDWQANRIVINIQPDEGIVLRFQAKQPGLRCSTSGCCMLEVSLYSFTVRLWLPLSILSFFPCFFKPKTLLPIPK